ncbi:HAD-IIB family hydrolase [Akkermansiaceae bacterium]|nr:HAD-IIB family hydrolase [Akkermansiaceae bacterium]MDB4406786.1 HAD-IIB family hydrolase [Akkermansiaceae bacterium]
MRSPQKPLVVTDLDGTLLDHDDYLSDEALPLLERLATLRIPVIANTSKTRAEWLAMRGGFSNEAAFVIENGSAIFFPDGESLILGSTRDEINAVLDEIRSDYQFKTFLDLGVSGIISHTGLPEEDAQRAGEREFSEPLVWQDDDQKKAAFCEEIARRGLVTLEGGRFLHVLGKTDKGRALEILRERYGADCIIALGDSPNDIAMLEQSDIACVIATTRSEPLAVDAPRVLRSTKRGPSGWAELMAPLLDELFSTHTLSSHG